MVGVIVQALIPLKRFKRSFWTNGRNLSYKLASVHTSRPSAISTNGQSI